MVYNNKSESDLRFGMTSSIDKMLKTPYTHNTNF